MDKSIEERLFAIFPMFSQYWDKIKPLVRVKNFPAKTTLLQEGDIAENLFVIIKGCLRLFFIKEDGSDYTSQFFFENDLVSSIESFIEKTPSRLLIETLEDSTVCILSASDLTSILKLHEDFKTWYNSYVLNRLISYIKLHSSFILDSPEKRYLKLIEENPGILDRLPHYYIASYLGITPVSFSRIRSRLKKRGNINKG